MKVDKGSHKMGLLINRRTLECDQNLLSVLEDAVENDLPFFARAYPDFCLWLRATVIPGLVSGERSIWIEQRDESIVGLLILKHSKVERKLCTLRVREPLQNRGMGMRLFERAFDVLGTDEPLLSVADSNLPKFQRIFDHFGFRKEGQYHGLYRVDSTEFSFNGLLVQSPRQFMTLGVPSTLPKRIRLNPESLELLA